MLAPLPRVSPLLRWLLPLRWLVLCSLAALSGCGAGYLLQAARGQAAVLAAREPVAQVIGDPNTAPALRLRLQQLTQARDFASRELGLPDNRSYRSYAALPRDFVVWNVVATPEFSTRPLRWCFPIAGCVTYRGYFHERSAQHYAQRLRRRGDDVIVAGVPAYSTLGHFADPLLSTLLRYGDLYVVGTIFHELAHQLLYVPGSPVFNESFAMTVEEVGVQRWLESRGRSSELEQWHRRQQRQRQQEQLMSAARVDLTRLYASDAGVEQMRQAKRARLARLAVELRAVWPRTAADTAPSRPLNNADLALSATYSQCVPWFDAQLASVDGDLPRFYARVRSTLVKRAQPQQAGSAKSSAAANANAAAHANAVANAAESAQSCCRGGC